MHYLSIISFTRCKLLVIRSKILKSLLQSKIIFKTQNPHTSITALKVEMQKWDTVVDMVIIFYLRNNIQSKVGKMLDFSRLSFIFTCICINIFIFYIRFMLFFYTHTHICIINIRQIDQAMTFYNKNCDVFLFYS